jgi:hypothetical protein
LDFDEIEASNKLKYFIKRFDTLDATKSIPAVSLVFIFEQFSYTISVIVISNILICCLAHYHFFGYQANFVFRFWFLSKIPVVFIKDSCKDFLLSIAFLFAACTLIYNSSR